MRDCWEDLSQFVEVWSLGVYVNRRRPLGGRRDVCELHPPTADSNSGATVGVAEEEQVSGVWRAGSFLLPLTNNRPGLPEKVEWSPFHFHLHLLLRLYLGNF